MTDLPGALHLDQRAERFLERYFRIDGVQLVEVDALELEPLQTAVEIAFELLRAPVGVPAAGSRPRHAALRGDDEPLGVGMQRLGDQRFVGVRSVALRGVEEIDPELDRAAKDALRGGAVPWLAPDVRSKDPHCAKAKTIDFDVTNFHWPTLSALQRAPW